MLAYDAENNCNTCVLGKFNCLGTHDDVCYIFMIYSFDFDDIEGSLSNGKKTKDAIK